jgi:cell division protein FtsL
MRTDQRIDPDYELEETDSENEEVRGRRSYGDVHFNGSTKVVMWILGVFSTILTTLMILVLQAVYNTNGDVHELKGVVQGMQAEITNIATGRSGVARGSP